MKWSWLYRGEKCKSFVRIEFAKQIDVFIIYVLYDKQIMKKLIIWMIVLMFIWSYTIANDCDIVGSDINWNFESLENWKYENILPQDAMKQAMLNLKWFCCEQNILQANTCESDWSLNPNWIYPSSAYLYDHILDVSMRRLDAKQENENGEDLIYGLVPDSAWLDWRNFITDRANDKNWSIPLEISDKFKQTREAQWNSLKAWSSNTDMPRDTNTFENYDQWRLVEKYLGVCETSMYLYLNFPWDKNKTKLNSAYLNCEKITNIRIKKEIDYTKAILMQKWNKFLYNNIKSYLDIYFWQNKLVALQQLIFNIKNTFNEINKAITNTEPVCS